MNNIELILVVLVTVLFILGIALGVALSRHCRRPASSPLAPTALKEVRIESAALPSKSEASNGGGTARVTASISARAVSTDDVAAPPPPNAVIPAKRTASLEVGDIYRTASALSIYLDEIESRPQLERLMSMPSLPDPRRLIEANHANLNMEITMDEIDLHEPVGRGGYGAVYKATWRGAVVAVKCVACDVADVVALEQSIREVVLSKKMGHPNVVQTYAWTVLTGTAAVRAASTDNAAAAVKAALAARGAGNEAAQSGAEAEVHQLRDAEDPEAGAPDQGINDSLNKPEVPSLPVKGLSVIARDGIKPSAGAQEMQVESPFAAYQRQQSRASEQGASPTGAGAVKRTLGFEDRDVSASFEGQKAEAGPLSLDELLSRGSEAMAGGIFEHSENCQSTANVLPRLCIPDGPPSLQQVHSAAFSDVSGGTASPGSEFLRTPAAPRGGRSVCPAPPRSHLSRASSLGSRPAGHHTPHFMSRPRTPDSFNRHAVGTSLFDGTEATPRRLPPRARRRISFEPGDAVPLPGSELLRSRARPRRPVAATSRRSRSLSPGIGRLRPGQAEEFAAPECSSGLMVASADQGTLPLPAPADDSPSPRSCASFNSEEGFGSPAAVRQPRRASLGCDRPGPRGQGLCKASEAVTVVVMEFCDLQSLHRAIMKKVFKPHGRFTRQATYRALLRTAQEVAKGMDYIHSFGIIHGDLKPGNVLLKTHRVDRRGYIAKVSDFGLSRPAHTNDAAGIRRHGLGTIPYTAPETFQDQCINKASDVYAFGILLWEMHHCQEAYDGLLEGQICLGVCDGSLRPEFDDDCPKELCVLTRQCWAQDPAARPSFKEIVSRLTEIEVAYRKECHLQKPLLLRHTRSSNAAHSPTGLA